MCSKCGLTKQLSEFYKRKKHRAGEYYEKCIQCMKVRGIVYYHQNHERQLKLALLRKKRYKEERIKFIEEFKRDKPCKDCGVIFQPWVMDFDHLEGKEKIKSISSMVYHDTSNFKKIVNEIKKCDLVCANCHRQRTYDRIQKHKFAAVANVVKAEV